MAELSKLQIRAKILLTISKLKQLNELSEDNLNYFYNELIVIDDKSFLFEVYLKELIKMNEQECIYSALILKNIIPENIIQDKIFSVFKSVNYSDDIKYKLVQFLKYVGINFDYNSLPQYFENPKEILDSDTKKLLESAVYNPEAMLDFLDFVASVPNKDRLILLRSLKEDYDGDKLANIIYPILYSNFDDDFLAEAVKILSESKSSLAIAPFKYLINVSKNSDIINACELGLKKLKLAGATLEQADKYYKNTLKNTVISQIFTTIPDGAGNQAFIITRYNNNDNKYSLSAVVISDNIGIIDCFGFYKISKNEIIRVIDKFYNSEGKYIVSPVYAKKRIEESINLTIKNKCTFPYEFICWNVLLSDISIDNFNIEQEILENIQKEHLNDDEDLMKNHELNKDKCINVNSEIKSEKDDILELLTKDYTFRWYITPDENTNLQNLIDYIYNLKQIDINQVNEKLKEYINIIFDKESESLWKNRILNMIYILQENKKYKDAELFYLMIKNDKYYENFKYVLMQRSIFNAFALLKENMNKENKPINIFRKKIEDSKKYDIKKLEKILILLKKSWIND